jgi:hypothetical protein
MGTTIASIATSEIQVYLPVMLLPPALRESANVRASAAGHHGPVARRLQALGGGESEHNIGGITKAAEAVLADALRLDVDARAELL